MQLKKGDKAPQFTGKDENGNEISLNDFKGHKLVFYFYPKDDTPGCTAESCDLRDNYELLMDKGYKVLGISSDGQQSHQKFKRKFDLPFPLIADEDLSIHELYGTWGEKQMFGKKFMGTLRTTFIINENGVVEEIFTKVKTKEHTKQILEE